MYYSYINLGNFAQVKFSEKEIIYALVNKCTATYYECTNLLDDSKFKLYHGGNFSKVLTYGREKRMCEVSTWHVPTIFFKRMACELIVACQNDFDIEYNTDILHVTFKKGNFIKNQYRVFEEYYLGRITIYNGFKYAQCKQVFETLKKAVKETSDSAIEKYFEEVSLLAKF
jgi:hypothetical protein